MRLLLLLTLSVGAAFAVVLGTWYSWDAPERPAQTATVECASGWRELRVTLDDALLACSLYITPTATQAACSGAPAIAEATCVGQTLTLRLRAGAPTTEPVP